MMDEPPILSSADYQPNHPWYYKLGGQPIPFADIPPSSFITQGPSVERVPRHGAGRQRKLSSALSSVEASLIEAQSFYEKLQSQGMGAISEHDKRLAAMMGEPQMAWYDAMARCYCHIVFLKSQVRNLKAAMPAEMLTGQLSLF